MNEHFNLAHNSLHVLLERTKATAWSQKFLQNHQKPPCVSHLERIDSEQNLSTKTPKTADSMLWMTYVKVWKTFWYKMNQTNVDKW